MSQRGDVKPWFVTGAKPTQQQFWTLFDYLHFKDELIQLDEVATLVDVLTGKADQAALDAYTGGELLAFTADGYYDLQAGYKLNSFVILPTVDMNIQVGLTVGGDELDPVEAITGNEGKMYVVPLFANAACKARILYRYNGSN